MYLNANVKSKIYSIRKEHHKNYRPKYIKACIALFICTSITAILCLVAISQHEFSFWTFLLLLFSFLSFILIPKIIFSLGNEDDRVYFQKCLLKCDNEDELAQMGLEDNCLDHIKNIFLKSISEGELEDVAWNKFIRDLHKKHDLRQSSR